MALISIGSAGNMVNQAASALGSNAITNALGIDAGTILTPSKFLTKFTPSTVFAYRSLAYELRTAKNFDVIFHWFPRCSQIRTMFSNAFSASDTDEINLLVQSVQIPPLSNNQILGNTHNSHFRCAMPGSGVNSGGMLNIEFLNTEFSYIAHCFYQWLCETESPFWIYGPSVLAGNKDAQSVKNLKALGEAIHGNASDNNDIDTVRDKIENGDMARMIYLKSETECSPFTRSDIEIKYYSSNMKELHSIWFMGAFPVILNLENLDNKPGTADGHTVTFTFDSMCISSPFSFNDSGSSGGSITSATVNVINSAASGIGGSNTAKWTSGLYDDTLTQIGNTYLGKLSRKLNNITNKAGSKLSSKLSSLQKKITA